MVAVIDTFIFGGADESCLDMLQCRLEELDSSPVTRHVIVESERDHQGRAKPLWYRESGDRFSAWHSKITYAVASLPPESEYINPWQRENMQRMRIAEAVQDTPGEDFVLLADVDEIPSPYALEFMAQGVNGMFAFNMRLAMFAVDWVHEDPTRISVGGLRYNLGALHEQRNNAYRSGLPLVQDAGWHFTWLGGPDAIKAKADQFCHLELREMILHSNDEQLLYEQGYTWHGDDGPYPPREVTVQQLAVEVDETWPAYIRERRCPESWFRPRF